MKKKLFRNTEEGAVSGVLAGLADYFGLDVVLWRVFFVVFVIFTGFFPGIIGYFVAWFIMPTKPKVEPVDKEDYVVYD